MSRQWEWQKKRIAQGKCMTCGKKAATKYYCRKHADIVAKREREKRHKNVLDKIAELGYN